MVWIIALLCLGLVGATGYYQGPVRAAFGFLGLLFGSLLAGPLSPLTKRVLPLLGLHHPAWDVAIPQALAFLVVWIIFKIAGQVIHSKIAVHFKYKVDDKAVYRWQRIYSRLGLCVGLLNGSVYFLLIMLLIYSGGYFTTEASSGDSDPAAARFLNSTRAALHDENLDRVLASFDMVPAKVYQAADIADLVIHNPLLMSRLGHYPPCLQLAEMQVFKDLGTDVQLQQMIATQASIRDLIEYPRVQAIMTNAAVVAQVSSLLGNDLDDIDTFLTTGQSPKYDVEPILGVWDIDAPETVEQAKKRIQDLTPKKLGAMKRDLLPRVNGLTLTATPDNQLILKQPNPDTSEIKIVATGTWKKDQDTYQANLPGSVPETSEVQIDDGKKLYLPKFGYVLAFVKEM